MDPARPEKRRFVRRQCALPIELYTGDTSFPIKAETSDLSPGGCYVRMLYAFAVGTKLRVVLWVKGAKMAFLSTVKTADGNVGNGIAFTGISEKQIAQLNAYLDEIQAPAANSDYIFR